MLGLHCGLILVVLPITQPTWHVTVCNWSSFTYCQILFKDALYNIPGCNISNLTVALYYMEALQFSMILNRSFANEKACYQDF